MSGHLLTGVACGVLVALMAVPSAGAAGRESGRVACPPTGGKVVVADARATVYEAAPAGDLPEYLHVFGCVRGGARRYELGGVPECGLFEPGCEPESECETDRWCGGVREEVLAGSMVAFEMFESGPEEGLWYVVVRDLRDGRKLTRAATGVPPVRRRYYAGVGPALGIVLKADGSVAWLARDLWRSGAEAPYFEVYAAEGSSTRLLAQGTGIDPSSLALAGGTVYWTQGGAPASAPLK
jgi:hypothetical protein